MKRSRVLSAVAISAASLLFANAAFADIIFLDPDTDDTVQSDGNTARVEGSLTCSTDQIGLSYRVTATVVQGNNRLTGSTGNNTCDGTNQTFRITAHKKQGPGLLPGSATLYATAQTGTPHVGPEDTTKANEVVVVVSQ